MTSIPSDPVQNRARAEMLLQRYFEKSISSSEADELAAYWDATPDFDTLARKNLEIHQIFSYFTKLEKSPIIISAEELRRKGTNFLGDADFRLDVERSPLRRKENASFAELPDFDELVRLVSDVPSEVKHAGNTTSKKKTRQKEIVVSSLKPASVQTHRRNLFLALAMFVLFGAGVYFEFYSSKNDSDLPNPKSLGHITGVVDPVFAVDSPILKPGQEVEGEKIRLESGSLEMHLKNNVRIVLEGPVVFNLQTTMKSFCREGRLSVEVPPGAEGFEVVTPLMQVRDLGTEFYLQASETECSTHVVTGTVTTSRLSNEWVSLTEGSAMISRTGNEAIMIPAEKDLYVDRKRMNENVRKYQDERLVAWNTARLRWERDPDLLFYLGFTGMEFDAAGLGETLGKTPASRFGCRNTVGRWPGKNAVEFSGKEDRIQLTSLKKSDSFTLAASVRIQQLSKGINVLLSVGDSEPGAFHWQIDQLGQIHLVIGERDGLQYYTSPPVVLRRQLNSWLLLTTTIDASNKTIEHYLDGRKIASFPWKTPSAIDLSQATIGNQLQSGRIRVFRGQLDEFLLLGRCLSQKEIDSFVPFIH